MRAVIVARVLAALEAHPKATPLDAETRRMLADIEREVLDPPHDEGERP